MRRALALVVVAAAALAGCGQAAPETAAPTTCVQEAVPAPLPSAFPAEVPWPENAVLTGAEERSGERLIVTAVAPGGFDTVLAFMQKAFPDAGLALGDGEVEEDDAESYFAGNGLTGRWTIRTIPACEGGVLVTVLAARD